MKVQPFYVVKIKWSYRLLHPFKARKTQRVLTAYFNQPELVKKIREEVTRDTINLLLYGRYGPIPPSG